VESEFDGWMDGWMRVYESNEVKEEKEKKKKK
jgi:hypothetical protein